MNTFELNNSENNIIINDDLDLDWLNLEEGEEDLYTSVNDVNIVNNASFILENLVNSTDLASFSYTIGVLASIGQKQSTISTLYEMMKVQTYIDYIIFVVSSASTSAVDQFFSSYSAATFGEFYRDLGLPVLVVYDDLSKQAVAYRQLSLLLRRPPGREAYPGDVFYIHSRLLERSAKLSNVLLGGGSLTALPIIETQAGDVTAYIPTNVISITDGQIFIEAELFYEGIKPAVSFGLSVSRIGSSAQEKGIKTIAGSLKLELAQFREVEAFAQFEYDLDKTTMFQLNRGFRLIEILKQDLYTPYSYIEQLLIFFLAINGFLDNVKVEEVSGMISRFLLHYKNLLITFNNSHQYSVDVWRNFCGNLPLYYKRLDSLVDLISLGWIDDLIVNFSTKGKLVPNLNVDQRYSFTFLSTTVSLGVRSIVDNLIAIATTI